jgi:hypothetical protein
MSSSPSLLERGWGEVFIKIANDNWFSKEIKVFVE